MYFHTNLFLLKISTIIICIEPCPFIPINFYSRFKWAQHLFKPWHLFPSVQLDGSGQGRMADVSIAVY